MKLIELPREAWQSIPAYIAPETRAAYLNTLLKAGFDTLEIGSITSPKVLPQMQGTLEVLEKLEPAGKTNIMVLVLNTKGADSIVTHEKVTHLSFPFAASPAFLAKNTHSTIEKTLETTEYIVNLCHRHNKKPIIYFSMAFGNPYGEAWDLETMMQWTEKLVRLGIDIIPLSNVASHLPASTITDYFSALIPAFPGTEFGLHLHTSYKHAYQQVDAAYRSGCRRFDSVIYGMGGCPMATDTMLGNLPTQEMLRYFDENNIPTGLDKDALNKAYQMASQYFFTLPQN
jgi:hydroxymethylglutaryl-CoA lyase